MTDDFIAAILTFYLSSTGKIAETPEDYMTAKGWEDRGIPLSIAQRGLETKLKRAHGQPWFPRKMRLSWAEDDVRELFEDWRRAVGPQGRG